MKSIYLKLYNPADTYVSPASTVYDAAGVLRDFPAAQTVDHVVHTDANGEILYGFYILSAMKAKYGINVANKGQAVQALEDAMNAEQEAQKEEAASYIAPEERIAAALEFQALASLPDIEEE